MALYQQSLDLTDALGDVKTKAATLSQMANISAALDRWDEAEKLLVTSLELGVQLRDVYGIGMQTYKLGQIAEHEDKLEEAAERYRTSITYLSRIGSPVAQQVRGLIAALEQKLQAGE